MNKKNVIEICVYIIIIALLLFGIGKRKNTEPPDITVPTVEMPEYTDRVQ